MMNRISMALNLMLLEKKKLNLLKNLKDKGKQFNQLMFSSFQGYGIDLELSSMEQIFKFGYRQDI